MQRSNRGWGYKIDYDREIALDLENIACAERHLPLAAALSDEERAAGPEHVNIAWFLAADREARAPLLGLTQEQASELLWLWDIDHDSTVLERPGWYRRARDQEKRLEKEFGGYIQRDAAAAIKAHKVRLARHRRNKDKYT